MGQTEEREVPPGGVEPERTGGSEARLAFENRLYAILSDVLRIPLVDRPLHDCLDDALGIIRAQTQFELFGDLDGGPTLRRCGTHR